MKYSCSTPLALLLAALCLLPACRKDPMAPFSVLFLVSLESAEGRAYQTMLVE